jgi:hypothetical protein
MERRLDLCGSGEFTPTLGEGFEAGGVGSFALFLPRRGCPVMAQSGHCEMSAARFPMVSILRRDLPVLSLSATRFATGPHFVVDDFAFTR